MFAEPKVRVKLRRRDKRVKRIDRNRKKEIERFHKWKVDFAYREYYEGAIY